MITLAFPWALLLLPLPLLLWLLFPPHRERVPALRFPFFRQIVETAGFRPGEGAVVLSRTRLQMAAAILVWALLVLALARPERLGEPVEINKSARDVILAIDISGSMDAKDFIAPNGTQKQRLEGVRGVVENFIAGREGDRMALIVFGSKAYVQAPLTEDLQTISELLSQTEVGMAGPHTALGDAIGLAIRTFEASNIEQRLLILLSDGTDTGSRMSPVNAAEIANDQDIEIYTIGVGDPNASGENRVDLATLKDIASRTGGAYFFAENEAGLQQVYDRIDQLAPRQVETLSYRPRQALAFLPLAAAGVIGTITIAWLSLGSARRRLRA
ncbi:VWA domain-containing protein [Aurantimonas endophytica]|uniref:Ca-activated chloride channel family protein n=1 Tax=Aurantimonas endophytica TaxID=1522175 RepID=A0A7W6HI66_9HYPH|nr:VWA domain-containing protein [Aurantimonas endophytica]MBB4005633.1 Ca-activated chloride channel family protein [Aurantimonas endophytica]MCO6406413.1 VWA domain-containing protein [Aurantimonas endophytica]